MSRSRIGDCLLTTPLLRALKRRFPGAHLAVSVPASNKELLITNPHIDEIVFRPKESSWAAKIRFALDMRRQNYDLIIQDAVTVNPRVDITDQVIKALN